MIEDDDIVDINITERKLDVRVSEQRACRKKETLESSRKRTDRLYQTLCTACNLRFSRCCIRKIKTRIILSAQYP